MPSCSANIRTIYASKSHVFSALNIYGLFDNSSHCLGVLFLREKWTKVSPIVSKKVDPKTRVGKNSNHSNPVWKDLLKDEYFYQPLFKKIKPFQLSCWYRCLLPNALCFQFSVRIDSSGEREVAFNFVGCELIYLGLKSFFCFKINFRFGNNFSWGLSRILFSRGNVNKARPLSSIK